MPAGCGSTGAYSERIHRIHEAGVAPVPDASRRANRVAQQVLVLQKLQPVLLDYFHGLSHPSRFAICEDIFPFALVLCTVYHLAITV